MSGLNKALLITGIICMAVGGLLFFLGVYKPEGAGILIESIPSASVYVNGEYIGKTPYEVVRDPGEITIKVAPQGNTAYNPYETKVNLIPGVKTIVRRIFGENDAGSAGEIVSYEKSENSEASLAVVSLPDSAEVKVSGQSRGFAPLKISNLAADNYEVVVSAGGYMERKLSLKTVKGYRLTLVIKLSKEVVATPSPTPIPELLTMVEILSTPTGFVRVRSEPSLAGSEIAQVKKGQQFVLLETDAKSGWYKIQLENGESGWVTNQYAKKIDSGVSVGPTSQPVTPSPTSI